MSKTNKPDLKDVWINLAELRLEISRLMVAGMEKQNMRELVLLMRDLSRKKEG